VVHTQRQVFGSGAFFATRPASGYDASQRGPLVGRGGELNQLENGMKDTIAKMRALVSMKSSLIEALRADLEAALRKVTRRDYRITALEERVAELEALSDQAWYEAMDKDTLYINEVCEEGYGPAMLHGEELRTKTSVAEPMDLTIDPDIIWEKDKIGPDTQ